MTLALRPWLEKLYWRMEHRLVPGLRSSQDSYQAALTRHVDETPRWLDLGCGSAILPAWKHESERDLITRSKRLVGVDRSLRSLRDNATIAYRVCGDISELPFGDASFDLVTANMVVEHMDNPRHQFMEIRRVLAPGGVFLCHTPNAFGYPTLLARLLPHALKRILARGLDGRDSDDVFKTYYRANSPARLRQIAAESDLRVAYVHLTLSSAVLAMIPPLALVELLWIRALRGSRLEALRPTMIAAFSRD